MIEIRRLGTSEVDLAGNIMRDIKGSDPDDSHAERFLSNPTNIFLAALVGGRPVGFALAYELERADALPNMMFFYEIEVAEAFRRQGIGRALVDTLRSYCHERSTGKMFVLTDRGNSAARALYASTGGRQECDDGLLFVYD